jgi:hypothetical protein
LVNPEEKMNYSLEINTMNEALLRNKHIIDDEKELHS